MAARSDAMGAMKLEKTPLSAPTEPTAATHLLKNLIDYAGLFPPASLETTACVANYAEYSQSLCNWILGRFILPAAKLDDFQSAFERLFREMDAPERQKWHLSALIGAEIDADLVRVLKFNSDAESKTGNQTATVESVEIKVTEPTEIFRIAKKIPGQLEAYFEIPPHNEKCFGALADSGSRAKIRTGGETGDKFPSDEAVVDFISRCIKSGVPFKATAGLHHPLRSVHRYTYQPDSPSGIMHGFINVFLAAALLRSGLSAQLTTEILEERTADSFQFDSTGVMWRGYRLRAEELLATRRECAISFGSCSFTEPIEDLLALKLI